MLTSLREKKKRRTRADILAAAAECFERTGYRNANMRDIAAAADVAYQTLYNYFPSKASIALALLSRDAETDDDGDADLVEGVTTLARALVTRIARAERELWLEAAVEAIRGGTASLVRSLDPGVGGRLDDLLASAQQRGGLDAYVDTAALVAVIESILNSALLDRATGGEHSALDSTAIATRIELVLKPYLRATG